MEALGGGVVCGVNCGAANPRPAANATKATTNAATNNTGLTLTAHQPVLEKALTSTSRRLGNFVVHLRLALNHLPPIFHSFLELSGQFLHFIDLPQGG